MERIIAVGANINEFCSRDESGTALVTAVRKQDIELAQLSLDNGADIDLCSDYQNGIKPLAAAVIQRVFTMTDFLLASGASSADAKALYAGVLHKDLITEKLLEVLKASILMERKVSGPN